MLHAAEERMTMTVPVGGACGSERGVIEGQDRGKDGTDEREYVFGRGR